MSAAHAIHLFSGPETLIIAALNYFLPRLTRREVFFAVAVPPGYRETLFFRHAQ